MELISYPSGRAYEADFGGRTLWNASKGNLT
jgi:hypothetical protein